MVLSILIATITAPGLLGSQEAIRQSQSKDKREEHRARRCNLIATCIKPSHSSRILNGRPIVLRNNRLWIDTGAENGEPLGHAYAGYYLPYPDSSHEGLVTTITDVAPIMNWVYIDRSTHQVRYGVRADAQPNLTGPFDCTRQDRRLTFDGWEGWCAVEEIPGLWALYFDVDDDGLRGVVGEGKKVLEVELWRKEKRFVKEGEARMQDQTTTRKVSVEGDQPVDEPLGKEKVVVNPGVAGEKGGKGEGDWGWKPMKIPKSIFEDPPPMVAPLVFRARTPPPAYSPEDHDEKKDQDGTSGDLPTEVTKEGAQPELSYSETSITSALSGPPRPAKPVVNVSPIPLAVPAKTSPGTEKRTTPKRSSGTKALAQAQKFEALAAGRTFTDEVGQKDVRGPTPENKELKYASSEYSNDGQEASGNPQPRRPSSPTPPPLTLAKPKEELRTVERSNLATKNEVVGGTKDPAIFSGPSRNERGPEQARRPTITRQPSQSVRPTQSIPSRTPQPRKDPIPQRKRSSSEQPYLKTASPSRSPSNVASRTASQPARTTLARTMTTGTGNRGMANRIADKREESRPMRGRSNTLRNGSRGVTERKTTSALFREIDDLVSQDTQGPGVNGSGGGGSGSRGDNSRRPDDGGKARWK
ncbi:hypothetical protein NX059_008051 [Plenodomus lindquistii]|nr:hypothetical protein NX059_008051 [Plenodomus lindquistii]